MLKKVILALALTVFTVNLTATAAPAARVNQSSKEAVVGAFLKAVFVDYDMNTVWNLLSPELQQKMLKANKNNKAATLKAMRTAIYSKLPKEQLPAVKKQMENKEFFDFVVKDAISKMGKDDMIQLKGKWYINNFN